MGRGLELLAAQEGGFSCEDTSRASSEARIDLRVEGGFFAVLKKEEQRF